MAIVALCANHCSNASIALEPTGQSLSLLPFPRTLHICSSSKRSFKFKEQSSESLSPEEVCHVGDHPDNDVEAAVKLGMKAIWLNLLDADWPEEKQFKPNEIVSWYDLEKGIADLESV